MPLNPHKKGYLPCFVSLWRFFEPSNGFWNDTSKLIFLKNYSALAFDNKNGLFVDLIFTIQIALSFFWEGPLSRLWQFLYKTHFHYPLKSLKKVFNNPNWPFWISNGIIKAELNSPKGDSQRGRWRRFRGKVKPFTLPL